MDIKELTHETWSDFESLMKTDAQCSDCWCLNHREVAICPTGIEAQEKMQILTVKQKVHGLLAYQNQECIAWIAVDPMSELIGHDCHSTKKYQEWAIHCLFVKASFRGKGVSVELIQAAVEYAKNQGAKLISAFPIPEKSRARFPVNEAEFSGRFSTYEKLGFISAGEISDFYLRMELQFEDRPH